MKTNLSSKLVTKLERLVEEKYFLLGVIDKIQKERSMFTEKIKKLEDKFLKSSSKQEKEQFLQKGELVYQKFEEKVLTLLNKSRDT